MKLSWGDYDFPSAGIQFAWSRRANLSPKVRRRTHYSYQMRVRALIQAAGASALTTALGTLETALGTNDKDLLFKDDSNSNTIHAVSTNTTINGISALIWEYPMDAESGMRTEYLNKRTVYVTFGWEVAAAETNIVEFDEIVEELNPGGLDFTVQQALSGLPQVQTTAGSQKQVYVQRGFSIGYSSYVNFPTALYSVGAYKSELSYRRNHHPLYRGRYTNTHFPRSWRYHFETSSGFVLGTPTIPSL
ncbi:hypothetical protein [Planctomicrobium piriforme]|uniref:Uncharacterized protein n=1 Tax=Planctomicrobium piriforme TaxID=1576369 RepID=A0A1I3EBN0_9PLAN|nr:hypothetical protein [Planctomicrobium piriforme]SFH96390.1 hypothetical protein SAMN05421753_104155 [Planctomicrobium piriforme]